MVNKGQSQLDKFKEAARDLDCDESEERFNENLKRIAKAKPKPKEPENGKSKNQSK